MKTIEEFITDFRTREEGSDSEETIRHLFRSGFCYYFANMLKLAYPGGDVCWACPTSHWVYRYGDKCYDIEGEYDPREFDVDVLIPENFVSPIIINDFLHRGDEFGATKEMIENNKESYLTRFPHLRDIYKD